MDKHTFEISSTHFNTALSTSLYHLKEIDVSELYVNSSGKIYPAIFVERTTSKLFHNIEYKVKYYEKCFPTIQQHQMAKILKEIVTALKIVPTANQFVFDKDINCFGARECAYSTGTIPFIYISNKENDKNYSSVNINTLSKIRISEKSFGSKHVITYRVGPYVIGTATNSFQDLVGLYTVKFVEDRCVEGSKTLTHLSESAFTLFAMYLSKLFELSTAASTTKGRYKELLTAGVIPLVPLNLYTLTKAELNAMTLEACFLGDNIGAELAHDDSKFKESIKSGDTVLFSQILDDTFPDSAPNLFTEDIVYVEFDKHIESVLNGNAYPLIDKKDIKYGVVEEWTTLTVLVNNRVPVDTCAKASIILENVVTPYLEVANVEREE